MASWEVRQPPSPAIPLVGRKTQEGDGWRVGTEGLVGASVLGEGTSGGGT